MLAQHIPGVRPIAGRVNGGSHEGAARFAGPGCTGSTLGATRGLLRRHGWVVTIDLFSTTSNSSVPRFASWTDWPNSEAVDAFELLSWNQSRCLCGQEHWETCFLFPP